MEQRVNYVSNNNEINTETNNENNNNETNNDNDTTMSIYDITNQTLPIKWSHQHEKILVDWADKATCYKWLHEKSHREFARKNRWFTIPVIIMSTVTGTANFAQERIPPEYVNVFTMGIGSISLVAGIITTIQQFLKISEMCESHRISSISWGKFHRNLKIELAKSPVERTPVTQLIKASKEEFDRLIETSQSVPNHIVTLFKDTFSGGKIEYDKNGNKMPLTSKQKIYEELTKPEICDSLESVTNNIYKPSKYIRQTIKQEVNETELHNIIARNEKKSKLETFINLFEKEKKRFPTTEEINDNIEDTISLDLIQTVLSDLECKYKDLNYKQGGPTYASSTDV
jgi:hypothetical protein